MCPHSCQFAEKRIIIRRATFIKYITVKIVQKVLKVDIFFSRTAVKGMIYLFSLDEFRCCGILLENFSNYLCIIFIKFLNIYEESFETNQSFGAKLGITIFIKNIYLSEQS